jgi:hypothetical protein
VAEPLASRLRLQVSDKHRAFRFSNHLLRCRRCNRRCVPGAIRLLLCAPLLLLGLRVYSEQVSARTPQNARIIVPAYTTAVMHESTHRPRILRRFYLHVSLPAAATGHRPLLCAFALCFQRSLLATALHALVVSVVVIMLLVASTPLCRRLRCNCRRRSRHEHRRRHWLPKCAALREQPAALGAHGGYTLNAQPRLRGTARAVSKARC